MPTLAPGSRRSAGRVGRQGPGGFTLLELLIVITLIALGTGLSVLSLRDTSRNRLEQEAARLSLLLEAARVESRTSGQALIWRPARAADGPLSGASTDFVFEPRVRAEGDWPTRWLHAGTRAEVIGASRLVLGPEPLIPPQRLRLVLGDRQLVLATDGLGAFSIEEGR